MPKLLLRALVIAVTVLIGVASAHGLRVAGVQTSKLAVESVYKYEPPKGWKGPMLAVLDSTSQLLYVLDQPSAVVQKIDWRTGKLVKQADFSSLRCIRLLDWGEAKGAERLVDWELIPGTPYADMRYCDSEYMVDTRTMEITRQLIDPSKGPGHVFFLPEAGQALIYRKLASEAVWRNELYRIDTWERVRQWDHSDEGSTFMFSADAKYIYYVTQRREPNGKLAACEVRVQELTTGREVDAWQLKQVRDCPSPLGFLGKSSDVVVDYTGDPLGVIFLRNIRTGQILRSIRMDGIIPKGRSVSPDGKYVVSGAWDDPQDSPISQDFRIWDLETGEVVYETPTYRSVWGSRTHGREVHPRFSQDGNYIILVKERSVELLKVIPPTDR